MMQEDDFAEYSNGPEQIIPVNNMITWKINGAVKLRLESSVEKGYTPISVPGLLTQAVNEAANLTAMKVRDPHSNEERCWTWFQYQEEVKNIAKAFIKLGLDRFESVCILGFNAPEWAIASLAAIHAGGLSVGVYPTNGREACKYILENSRCSILVVEDQKQLDKVWEFRNEIASLNRIIQYSGTPSHPGVLSWKDVLAEGAGLEDYELEARQRRIAVNQACTIIYTSGTTGNPKGVMLSHDNLTFTAKLATATHKFDMRKTRILSYLPLSHVAAYMVDIFAPMAVQGTTFFADKDALKGTLKDNLLWCRPTQFLGVPRIWEKIMEGMLNAGRGATGLKKNIGVEAKKAGLKYHLEGEGEGKYKIMQKVVYSKVKKALGLDCCKGFYSGAAPIELATLRYFMSLDMKILELYGMSECTGPCTMQTRDQFKERSVGVLIDFCKTKLVPSSDPDVGGKEIWMWGRNVMMGYLNREDATRKDMTEDGWLKSGDLGEIDAQGFHFIVGREKDLIITAGGENVAPQPIHCAVKEELPIVSNILLLGDKQKFISCFLTLAVDVDPVTQEPSSHLTPGARAWCREIGSNASTVQEVLQLPDRKVLAAIQAGIDRANGRATSNAQRIARWMILPKDFSLADGDLTPTMKVKRNIILKKYERSLQKIYNV